MARELQKSAANWATTVLTCATSTNTRGPAVTGQCGEGLIHYRPASMNGICRQTSCWPIHGCHRGGAALLATRTRARAVASARPLLGARETRERRVTRSECEFEPITFPKKIPVEPTQLETQALESQKCWNNSPRSRSVARSAQMVGASSLRVGRRVLLPLGSPRPRSTPPSLRTGCHQHFGDSYAFVQRIPQTPPLPQSTG